MQALAFAQGFSHTYSVNLILCNHHHERESGSGIFSSGEPLATYFELRGGGGKLAVADIPNEPQTGPNTSVQGGGVISSNMNASAATWQFKALGSGPVCSNNVCCHAKVSEGHATGYVIAALDGQDHDGDLKWGAQACAILVCEEPGEGCLKYQGMPGKSLSLHSIRVFATGVEGSEIFPEITSSEPPHKEQVFLSPGKGNADGSFTIAEATSPTGATQVVLDVKAAGVLSSVVLYGQVWSRDALKYDCK